MLHSKVCHQSLILIVKSSFARNIGTAAVVFGLAGCGQTGPLYMPKPVPQRPGTTVAPAPLPPPPSSPAGPTTPPVVDPAAPATSNPVPVKSQ